MRGGSAEEPTIGVLLVRKQTRLFSDVLSEALKAEPSVRLLTRPLSMNEAVEFCSSHSPDVILLEGTEVSAHSLRGLIRPVRAACQEAPVVLVVDEVVDDQFFVAAIEAGAAGLVDASGAIEEVLSALRAAVAGTSFVDSDRLVAAIEKTARSRERDGRRAERLRLLSDREREVLGCLSKGLRNSEIAGELLISPRTVEKHVHHILAKLEVSSRLAAVTLASASMGDIAQEAMRGTA